MTPKPIGLHEVFPGHPPYTYPGASASSARDSASASSASDSAGASSASAFMAKNPPQICLEYRCLIIYLYIRIYIYMLICIYICKYI